MTKLRAVETRVFFQRNEEHEWKCIKAIRRRDHPAWSRLLSSYEVEAK